MELSCKIRYALRALIVLSSYYAQRQFLPIDKIAAIEQIPERYLAQLFTILRRGGLIRSQKGGKGGYLLARAPEQITVFDVLVCLQGSPHQEKLIQTDCSTIANYAIQNVWQEATNAAIAVFQSHTLQQLYEKQNENQQLNLMYYI